MAESGKKWYVLRAVSGKEAKVKEYIEAEMKHNALLTQYVSQVLIPTEKHATLRNGKRVVKEKISLPGYVLVEAELKGDVYICSANGIAETGEIVNIDGSCNRLSNSTYAQDLSIFIIGKNKIEPTLEKAIWRARNIAAPLNARRQHMKTPCAYGEMKCHDCSSPDRICHVMSIIWQKPIPMDQMWVILINEDLGY